MASTLPDDGTTTPVGCYACIMNQFDKWFNAHAQTM